MPLILTAGDWRLKMEYLHHLLEAGYLLALSPQPIGKTRSLQSSAAVGLVAALNGDNDVATAASLARRLEVPWLGLDCCGTASMAAYRNGALAVLPPGISPVDVENAIVKVLCDANSREAKKLSPEIRRYRINDPVEVDEGAVIEIRSGVLAVRASLSGGSELLMGLFGSGDFISAHPVEVSHVQMLAHSTAEVSVHRWADVATTWDFAHRTRRLQSYLTAWYSVHSHPRVQQRILVILSLLAERFGRAVGAGWKEIGVRLTHQQIADAVCASRPTVSTAMRTLSKAQIIKLQGTGDNRRVCLNRDLSHHGAIP